MLFARSALSRNTCAVVPVVVEIFLPLRSAKLLIPWSVRTHSCAVANSTSSTRNILPCPRAGKFEITAPVVEHVDAAADHRLEELEPGRELHEIELDARASRSATVDAEPDLAVDRERVQVADLHLRARLRDRRRAERRGTPTDAAACRILRLIFIVVLLWSGRFSLRADCCACAAYSLITRSRICERSSLNSRVSCSDSVARIRERDFDDLADARWAARS